MKTLRRFWIAAAVGVLGAVYGAAAEAPTLIILPFDSAGASSRDGAPAAAVPNLLTAFISAGNASVQLVERQKLETIMTEQSLKWEHLTAAQASQVGHLAQARYLLRGSVAPRGDALRIEASLYETETTQLVKTFDVDGERTALNALCEKLAGDVSAFFGDVPAKGIGLRELPSDPDPETNLHLMKGLAAYYQGEYAKAIPEFMKILIAHPRHALARLWLAKSYQAAGLNGHAAVEAPAKP